MLGIGVVVPLLWIPTYLIHWRTSPPAKSPASGWGLSARQVQCCSVHDTPLSVKHARCRNEMPHMKALQHILKPAVLLYVVLIDHKVRPDPKGWSGV